MANAARGAPASEHARHWALDPSIAYLNHGAFGACPTHVLAAQARLRERIERGPARFFVRDLERLLDDARAVLAEFVGADAADLAFVPNATVAVNTVLRALRLAPGDEILTTDHAYGACRNAALAVAERTGARVVVAPVPLPIEGPGAIADAVLAAATPRSRIAMIDHVSSATAIVFPISEIVARLAARGIDTLVDGAHAPGMIALDIDAIGAAYTAGHGHKWLCAPKGAAFLHVRRDRQDLVDPLVISHGARSKRTDRSRFHLQFDWVGTSDPTPFLCVAESIRFLGTLLPGGWPALMERNRSLARAARAALCAALGIAPPCPDAMLGSMATLPLPDAPSLRPVMAIDTDLLQDALLERFAIEVPVLSWPAPPRRVVRVSAQLYNTLEQYERLGAALRELLWP
jgi:isopenicillin-N epimerase